MDKPIPLQLKDLAVLAMVEALDLAAAQRKYAGRSRQEVEVLLHRSRYLCRQIRPELRHASGQWLRERKLNAYLDMPLLPEGELP